MRVPSNPFLITGYHSPAYFCDREKELAVLIDQFKNERNVVLSAWRRLGKTALIRHYFQFLESNNLAETLYVDILGTSNMADAHLRMSKAVINRYGDISQGMGEKLRQLLAVLGATFSIDPLSGMPEVSIGLSNPTNIGISLDAIGQFLNERNKPVVICIDEFQQIVNYPEKTAEALFRSWSEEHAMIRFVFSGSHRHMMESMFSDQSRPFYQSAQIQRLDFLPVKEYTEFIKNKFQSTSCQISDEHIAIVLDWTKRQTYYSQLVFNILYGDNEIITSNKLIDVFQQIIQQEIPIYSSYQQLMTHFQWKLLVSIAKAEKVKNPMSKDFINQFQLGTPSSVSTALKMLEKKEFVIRLDQGLVVHDTLLMRWLQKL